MAQIDYDRLLKVDPPETDEDWQRLRYIAQNLFKPKAPVDDDKLFNGRIDQINEMLDAVYEQGAHAIIFGERGVGKTSLANIIEMKIGPVIQSLNVSKVSCGKNDDFFRIWGNAFNNFSIEGEHPEKAFRKSGNPYDIYNAIEDLSKDKFHLFVFDEFDRIQDKDASNMMADLIKHLSNNPKLSATVVIVGVSGTLMDLFLSHESIVRCCSQIRMPRMSPEELDEIIDERLIRIGFSIENDVKESIRKLSQGLPGYVHLLGQISLKSAISDKRTTIEERDFRKAISEALEKSDHLTKQQYLKATTSPRTDSKYKEVLLACALAKTDDLGHFYAKSVKEPYSMIRKKPMEITHFASNLSELCSDKRGPTLIRSGEQKRYRYRFANPLIQPLAIMQGLKDGLIDLQQSST